MSAPCPCCGGALDPTPILTGLDRLHGTPGEFGVAVCRSCGAGVTVPPVEPDELGAFYPDSYGPYDAARGGVAARVSALIQGWQGRRAISTPPLGALASQEPGLALEVGCGRGDLAAFLIEGGWRVTGVEPSRAACDVAGARGVDARCGSIDEVELEPAAYDAAIFRHSLEHLTDPVAALRRVHRAVRPGGLVLISVPNFDSWQRRRFGSRWYHLDLPRHRVHFTASALTSALKSAGLEAANLTTSTSPVGLPASIQYAVAGRCLFPTGLSLRVAVGLSALGWPVAWLADRLGDGGDVLDAVAHRPKRASTRERPEVALSGAT